MKLFRLVMIVALLGVGFAFPPTQEIASAACIDESGNGETDVSSGWFSMPANSSITFTVTSSAGSTNRTLIVMATLDAGLVIDDVADTTVQTVTYTFLSAAEVIYAIDWETNGDPANMYTVITSTCNPEVVEPEPGPDMVEVPDTAVVGTFLKDAALYYTSAADAQTTNMMSAGQSLWVAGVDSTGAFYKVLLSGQWYWVPVESMGPNYDDVWNGTPLPTEVVE